MIEFILGHMAEEEFTEGPAREMVRHLLTMYESNDVQPQRLLEGKYGKTIQSLAVAVMVDPHEPSENWRKRQNINVPGLHDDPEGTAASAMTILKRIRVDEAIRKQKDVLFQAQQRGEDVRIHLERMSALHRLRQQIEQRAFLGQDAA